MILLKSGEHHEPSSEDVIAWQHAYSKIDVHDELNAMSMWCHANPSKRKTKVGINRFINSWLKRANDQGGSPQQFKQPEGDTIGIRAMTLLDMQTDNFTGSQHMREFFMTRYGQYFEDGKRYTRSET